MRDLGQMGESTFRLWCNQAGLIANDSKIDRTGWDYLVEFSIPTRAGPTTLHHPAIECKVQVKATDKNSRKVSITLSNLRRLATAQMPTFVIILEFDKKEVVQRAFLVHIDEDLITKILRRLHERETIQESFDHHKSSMQISYGDKNEIPCLNGESLKAGIERFIPNGMSAYVAEKNKHLASTGFEKGYAHIRFSTDGEQGAIDLIDVSIGLKQSAKISKFTGFHSRFGITSKKPMFESASGILEMPDIKPTTTGTICFRESKLLPGLAFPCKIYSSPLNLAVPRTLEKFRIDGEHFDISMNPHTGAAQYRFKIDENTELPITQLRDVIRLMRLVTTSGKKVLVSILLDGAEKVEFSFDSPKKNFEFAELLDALESSVKICQQFDLGQPIKTSLKNIGSNGKSIINFCAIFDTKQPVFRCDFSVQGDGLDVKEPVACINLVSIKIGDHVLGALVVTKGRAISLEPNLYSLISSTAEVKLKITSDERGTINKDDLIEAVRAIEVDYLNDFQVVTLPT